MMRKYKFFLFFFIFLFVLFFWGKKSIENRKMTFIESLIPNEVKFALKKAVWNITTQINIHKIKFKYLLFKAQIKSYEVKSRSNTYSIKTFQLPYLNIYEAKFKPVAYLEQYKNKIVIAFGYGDFYSFEKKDITSDNINLKKIKSNIKNLIKNDDFFSYGPMSIRDLLILDNKIFFSFVKEQTSGCYNTSIINAKFNLNYLNFSEFFSYEECLPNKNVQQYPRELRGPVKFPHSGGRMVSFKNEKILLTIGDLGYMLLAQDKNSIFGKIISIDLQSKDYEIISMGSRNAQGLYYDKDENIIIFTEHGPYGGDEININFNPDNEIIENYGWPISSYGQTIKKFPLYESHKDYGFIEPIKYYYPAIAISEIVRIPRTFNEKFTNDFFIGALGHKSQLDEGDRSIHHIRFNKNFDQIIFNEVIPIDERIRDMIFIKEKNIVLMVLESIPAIGVLKLKK